VLFQDEICASLIVPSMSGAIDWSVLSKNEDDILNIACKVISTILCDWHYFVVCQHNSWANFTLRQISSSFWATLVVDFLKSYLNTEISYLSQGLQKSSHNIIIYTAQLKVCQIISIFKNFALMVIADKNIFYTLTMLLHYLGKLDIKICCKLGKNANKMHLLLRVSILMHLAYLLTYLLSYNFSFWFLLNNLWNSRPFYVNMPNWPCTPSTWHCTASRARNSSFIWPYLWPRNIRLTTRYGSGEIISCGCNNVDKLKQSTCWTFCMARITASLTEQLTIVFLSAD